jgi:hypothetical protein
MRGDTYLIPCPGPQLIWWRWTLEQPVCMDTQSSPVKKREQIKKYELYIMWAAFILLNSEPTEMQMQKQKWLVSVFFCFKKLV